MSLSVYSKTGNGWSACAKYTLGLAVTTLFLLGCHLSPGTTAQAAVVQDISYTYSNGGMISGIADNKSSYNWTYQYDDLYRLTGARRGEGTILGGGTEIYNKAYAYNNIGNITNFEGQAYIYADTAHKHAVTAAGSATYTYDANGNMLAGADRAITWNSENKPVSVTKGTVETTFVYGTGGERVKKETGDNWKIYVGGIYEKDQTGAQTCYIDAAGVSVKKKADGSLFFILKDHLGGASVITDAQGNAVTQQYYEPYGKDDANGSLENEVDDHKFTSQEEDTETGLYYYNARYYDPALGRFISADPVQGLNRYSYCYNNPVNVIDPSGCIGEGWLVDNGDSVDYYPLGQSGPVYHHLKSQLGDTTVETYTRDYLAAVHGRGSQGYPKSITSGNVSDWYNSLDWTMQEKLVGNVFDYQCSVDPVWAEYSEYKADIMGGMLLAGLLGAGLELGMLSGAAGILYLNNLLLTWELKLWAEMWEGNYDTAYDEAFQAVVWTAGIGAGDKVNTKVMKGDKKWWQRILNIGYGSGGRAFRGTATNDEGDFFTYLNSQGANGIARTVWCMVASRRFGIDWFTSGVAFDMGPSNANFVVQEVNNGEGLWHWTWGQTGGRVSQAIDDNIDINSSCVNGVYRLDIVTSQGTLHGVSWTN